MRRKAILVCVAAVAVAGPAAAEDAFKVIANPSSGVATLTRPQLSQVFLKRTTRWPNGQLIQPVETSDRRVRTAFCAEVHGKSLNALKSYWNQLIFTGREVPPLEKTGDEGVLDYVRSTPGAIGYVSSAAATTGVKVVAVKE